MKDQIKPMLLGAALVLVGVAGDRIFDAAVPPAQAQGQAGGGWCKLLSYQFQGQLEQDLGQYVGRGGNVVSFFIDDSNRNSRPYTALVCGR